MLNTIQFWSIYSYLYGILSLILSGFIIGGLFFQFTHSGLFGYWIGRGINDFIKEMNLLSIITIIYILLLIFNGLMWGDLIDLEGSGKGETTSTLTSSNDSNVTFEVELLEKTKEGTLIPIKFDNNSSKEEILVEQGESSNIVIPKEESSVVLDESSLPDSCIISSPLEDRDLVRITDILSDLLTLNQVVIYFLIMVLFIITSKLLLDRNYSFSIFKTNKVGTYFSNLIEAWIGLWKGSAYYWIYFLLLISILFTGVGCFAIQGILLHLKGLS